MNENYQLEMAKLPNIFTALSYSNQFLKLFSLLSMGLNILMILAIIGLGYKKPIVIPLSSDAQILATTNLPKAELEISAAIKKYLELRYNWEQTTVSKQLGAAESFIQGSELKVFRTAMSSVAKFSTEKLVSQKVYPSQININLKNGTASIKGDRISTIQGMKMAGELKLELNFTSGQRTNENPWGIYIQKEKEE